MNRPRAVGAALAVLALVIGIGLWARVPSPAHRPPVTTPAPADQEEATRCARCHPDEVARWRGSGHARALRPASRTTVSFPVPAVATEGLGPHAVDIRAVGDQLIQRACDLDGTMRDFPITHVVGGFRRERYLTALPPDGRPHALPSEYDVSLRQFVPFWTSVNAGAIVARPATDPLYWRGRQDDFAAVCVRCHTPRTRVAYDPDRARYAVDWGATPDAIGLSCTGCHGDASAHARAAASGVASPPPPTEAPCPDRRPAGEVEACGRCHVTADVIGPPDRPGMPFFDTYAPVLLDADVLFWADGRLRDEAYNYLAHQMSPCFTRGGMRCQDCHDAHGDGPAPEGRQRSLAACARCHPKPPGVCGGHPGAVAGSPDCLDCHMPPIPVQSGARTMADHRVAVPDPTLTRLAGIPNACARCHAADDVSWLESSLAAWGGRARPERRWTLDLAAGLTGDAASVPGLLAILSDPKLPWPVQATAARLLGRFPGPDVARALAARAGEADHPMVRAGALFGLMTQEAAIALPAMRRALQDPRAVVRLMAAGGLALHGSDLDLRATIAELERACAGVPDHPEIRTLLGYARDRGGDIAGARTEYLRAAACSPLDERAAARVRDVEARLAAARE